MQSGKKSNLKGLDDGILKVLSGQVGNKIIGEIFESRVRANITGISNVEVIFANEDGTVWRKADGCIEGSTLVEIKAVISAAPTDENKKQMNDYAKIIKKGTKGYMANDKAKSKVGPFSNIWYIFSKQTTAEKWEKTIKKAFEGIKSSIYVGKDTLDSLREDI